MPPRNRAGVALRLIILVAVLATPSGCDAPGTIGSIVDMGSRCTPIVDEGCDSTTCALRSDPDDDACIAPGSLALNDACTVLDACARGMQCGAVVGDRISMTSDAIASNGHCFAVCARDMPACGSDATCRAVATSTGAIRIDYGLCAP